MITQTINMHDITSIQIISEKEWFRDDGSKYYVRTIKIFCEGNRETTSIHLFSEGDKKIEIKF